MPPLSRWLAAFLLPSLLSIVTTYIVLRLYFRRELNSAVDASSEPVALTTDGKLVLLSLAFVVAVLLTASAFGEDLGLPTFVAAVAITAVLLIRTRSSPVPILKQISWSTIALVAALFILVEAVESIGALNFSQHALLAAQQLVAPVAALTVGFTVAIANNLVNNLPLGLIAANTLTLTHTQGLLRDVTLIAIDLGPNLSVTGSLATILWLLALRREGLNVTFFDFLKVGLLAMPVALLASIAASLSITLFTTAH